jgi:hypothetical protein
MNASGDGENWPRNRSPADRASDAAPAVIFVASSAIPYASWTARSASQRYGNATGKCLKYRCASAAVCGVVRDLQHLGAGALDLGIA